MKIQSSEIAMQSKNIEYKTVLESQLSFETYFTNLEESRTGLDTQLQEPMKENGSCMCSYLKKQDDSLNGIIQSLIAMLQERVASGTQKAVDKDNVNGYVKMSQYQKFEEFEQLDFSTTGTIQTATDSLEINLNFSMSRSFVVENQIDIYSPFDPLVINLDGELPSLETDTFSFDLDNDGKKDEIASLGAGSGFLALDTNKDGKINQGSELFGTRTGDGFGELSAYDEDHNNWIDENDSVFDSLQVWLKNESSQERELVALADVGIGAIYLDSTQSQFTYKTQTNQTLGEMKSSGIFLYEDGKVGNISQIDLAMRSQENAEEQKEEAPLAQLLQA